MALSVKLVGVLACFVSVSSFAENWEVLPDKVDPMSTIQSYYSASPATTSLSRLSSPYNSVRSWVGVGCNDNGHYWAFIGFTDKNFAGGEWKHGHTEHYTKIKYDESLSTIHLIEADNGRKFLNVAQGDTKVFIEGLITSNKVITGVKWYGYDDVWFEYSMKNSAKSVSSIFEKCGIAPFVIIKNTPPSEIESSLIDRALDAESISPLSRADKSSIPSLHPPKSGDWTLQIATFKARENALRLSNKLGQSNYPAYFFSENGLFKVYVGSEAKQDNVEVFKDKIKEEFGLSGIVVKYLKH